METDVYSHEKEFENTVNRTNPEIQTSGETYQIINQTEGISNRKTGNNLTTETTINEQQTSRNTGEKSVKDFTERAVNKEMSQDSAIQKEYNCRQLRERQSVSIHNMNGNIGNESYFEMWIKIWKWKCSSQLNEQPNRLENNLKIQPA